jgi:TolB-like protein/cytochrome c-type biogenesis protein CcmH/NrfG
MAEALKAVFLSYAREDADVARRIAEALRSHGVEVWFDQNELRGGDAWDAKIRQQINDCTLFLPIISAHTQERNKGYFRLEWKLAVEQTHLMAEGMAFLAPVVVDDTTESGAVVPPEFMRVQWTRLPGALPTPQFVEQVRKLLEKPQKTAAKTVAGLAEAGRPGSPPPAASKGIPGWMWGVPAAVLVAVAIGLVTLRKPEPPVAPPKIALETKPVPSATPVAPAKSIAVLPFTNMSEEKDASAFFADGVHEDVLTNLSFIRDLRVISRTSVMQYRDTRKPIGQIAAELGVAYVLEGSVRRAGGKVRVTGQLIRAATDEHVWAKSYDRDLTDVFAIQAELAQAIAVALRAAISPAEKSLLERKPTDNPAAYDLYVKARAAYEGLGNYGEPIESWLVDAVQLDPGFAQAWAQLAAHHASQHFQDVDASATRLEKAKAAIETAVRLAPDDPIVIEMQGDYFYYGYRDYTRAAAQYQRLLTLRPNSAEAFGSLGLIRRRQGRWADAIANLRKALEIDPRNLRNRSSLAGHLFWMRRYDETLVETLHVTEISAGDLLWESYAAVTIPYFSHGSVREGEEWFASLKSRPEDEPRVLDLRKNWARLRGDFAEAIRLGEKQRYFDGDGVPHWQQDFNAATDYIGHGDLPGARARLEKLLPELKAQLIKQPSNSALWTCLGRAAAALGDREQALAGARKLAELLPESADAVAGVTQSMGRAKILAWAGEKDQTLAELARLLRTPYGANIYIERHDPGWIPLHGDLRFEALLNDPKNNEPLF